MGVFRPERYVVASSLDEVIQLLQEHGDRARIIAGGTTIHELGAHRLLADVTTLVDIAALGLDYARADGDAVRIGAATTFTDLLTWAEGNHSEELDVMVDAVRAIRPMQVRNVATVGGSLCSSLPYFDLPPALVALGAEVRIRGPNGTERLVPMEEFFLDYFTPDLEQGEILTEIVVPRSHRARRGAFRKLETNSVDWALASVAARVGKEDGAFSVVRIVLGGAVGRKIVRARTVEQALEGRAASEDTTRLAAELVERDVEPRTDFRASADYRLEIYRVYIRRCIETALSRMPE